MARVSEGIPTESAITRIFGTAAPLIGNAHFREVHWQLQLSDTCDGGGMGGTGAQILEQPQHRELRLSV